MVVGTKGSAAATKITPKSATVTYSSNKTDVATVNSAGEVTGVKAGEAVITATMKCGTVTKTATTKVTVKTYDFQSVSQTKAAELKVVITGDAKSVAASGIKITNTSNNVSYPVKSYDAEKGLVTTYQDMKDGKEYKVVIGDTEKTFTATDGVVAGVGLESNTVVVGKETKVKGQTMDAKGVILDTVEYPGNGTVTVTDTNIAAGGYVTTEGLYLDKIGDTATFDVVYHSGKWDNATGTETVVERKGLVVTAVDAAAIDGWAVKVGKPGASFATVKETKVAVNDTDRAAYLQMTDSAKTTSTDISNFTVESSDVDTLVVSQNDEDDKNGMVTLTPNKVGTAYLVIRDEKTQNVVKTLPIVIVAQRKPVSISLDKSSVSLTSDMGGYTDTAVVTVTVKDQYGEAVNTDKADGTTLVETDEIKINKVKVATAVAEAKGKVTVTANNGVSYGTVNGKPDGEQIQKVSTTVTIKYGDLSKKLALNLSKAPTGTVDGRSVVVSTSRADSVITTTDATTIDVKVFDTVKGAKKALASDVTQVTLSKGNKAVCVAAVSSGALEIADVEIDDRLNPIPLAVSGGSITINVNDPANGLKLDAGAYTLKVEFANTDVKPVTQSIVITDTQPKITVSRVKMSGNSVADCFNEFYDGKKLESVVAIRFYDANDNDVSDNMNSVSVSYAIVTIMLDDGVCLKQKVNIGLTVRVE